MFFQQESEYFHGLKFFSNLVAKINFDQEKKRFS